MSVDAIKSSLWKQFGASMDMLENAILLIPDTQWTANKRPFYMVYHCIVFLDYYLTIPFKGFSPVLPFTVAAEADIPAEALDDLVPNRIYTKKEILVYLHSCR